MGHGGKRPGAGRRPLLSEEDRINIALKYERLVDELSKLKLAEDKAKHDDLFPLLEKIKSMNKMKYKYLPNREMPVRLEIYDKGYPRAAVVKKFNDKDTPIGQGVTKLDDLVYQIRGIVDIDLKGKSGISFTGPTDFREDLFKQIATEFTSYLGVEITPSYVRSCVDRLRREVKEEGSADTEDQT